MSTLDANRRTGVDRPGASGTGKRISLAATLVLALALPASAQDAPHLTHPAPGLTCLDDVALVASERDREATRLQLREAQVVRVQVVAVSVLAGVVAGAAVAVLVMRRP